MPCSRRLFAIIPTTAAASVFVDVLVAQTHAASAQGLHRSKPRQCVQAASPQPSTAHRFIASQPQATPLIIASEPRPDYNEALASLEVIDGDLGLPVCYTDDSGERLGPRWL